MCQVNAELKLLVKERDTGTFVSMSLTGNLFCYSWKVINLHCERILLRVATLPCKVHYMEMLQAIKQKWQICVHFNSISIIPVPSPLHHYFSTTFALIFTEPESSYAQGTCKKTQECYKALKNIFVPAHV